MKLKPSILVRELYGSSGPVQVRRWRGRLVAELRRRNAPPTNWPNGWLKPWHYRFPLTVPSGAVLSNLENFCLLLSLQSSALYDHAASDGRDLRVTASDGYTLLHSELDTYDAPGPEAHATLWACIPSLPHDASTTLYLYFGNADADAPLHPELTWPTEYRAVHHCRPLVLDSTSYANNATSDTSTDVPGAVARARQCYYQRILLTTSDSLQLPATYTVAGWARQYSPGSYVWPAARGPHQFNDGPGIRLYADRALFHAGGSFIYNTISDFDWTQWYHLAGVVNGASSTLYVNGLPLAATATQLTPPSSSYPWGITMLGSPTAYGRGAADEVRLIAAPLSAAHVQADYLTQSAPAAFYNLGPLESFP